MLKEEIYTLLNNQFNAELYSSCLYLALAGEFEYSGFMGFGSWMRLQSKEEHEHAMKIYYYILERGEKPFVKQLEEPPNSWKSPLRAMETALKHEQQITSRIHELMKTSKEHEDYSTCIFLNWFVREQDEEEDQLMILINRMKMVETSPEGLLFIDKEMAKRVKRERHIHYQKNC